MILIAKKRDYFVISYSDTEIHFFFKNKQKILVKISFHVSDAE